MHFSNKEKKFKNNKQKTEKIQNDSLNIWSGLKARFIKKNEGFFFFNAKAEKCQIACRTRNSESKGSFLTIHRI